MVSVHTTRRKCRLSRSGATLIEVLAVVGVILVLAAVLVPVIGVVRAYARRTICAGRLHTLYTAMMVYAKDYDSHLPVVHFKDIARDPTFDVSPQHVWPPYPPVKSPPRWYTLHYAMGDYVSDAHTFFCPAWPTDEFAQNWPRNVLPAPPAEKWAQTYVENVGLASLDLRQLTWPLEYAGLLRCDGHRGRAYVRHFNILFADGHVREVDDITKFVAIRERWSFVKDTLERAYGHALP